MIRDQKNLRRWFYRILPATFPAFYSARRRGLDHGATGSGRYPVAEIQKKYLLGWVGVANGTFLELDAGDGVTGSHAVWLEEAGWKGFCLEERTVAAELLRKNRPASFISATNFSRKAEKKIDLLSARRDGSIRRVVERIVSGERPNWVILQARDPRPEVFAAMNRAGYRLDYFIHDDEYYRRRDGKNRGTKGIA